MPNKVSVCCIKIEIDEYLDQEDYEGGAVSAEHPTNPRTQKERERDRGLRRVYEISIRTYTNTKMNIEPKLLLPTSSREASPLEEGGNSSEFPREIPFFSGNPFVEVTKGILHFYKKNENKEFKDAPSNQLCLLAVPSSMSCHDILKFVAPCHSVIQHIRIIRDGSPNQFIVLLEFRNNDEAHEFYKSYNGTSYNSLEPDLLCHAVWVSNVEWAKNGIPPLCHTELPTCPVCLERMDESVDGVLTILCNHAFHANCLMKWGDSTCPVCRHVQTPELLENSVCMECEGTEALWICLICGHVGCGRYQGGHAAAHYRATSHTYAMQLGTTSVWDYAGDNFVHRLIQNKADGKLVATTDSPEQEREEKIDSIQLEFTYLLTSQLDTQRKYYEGKLNKLDTEYQKEKKSSDEIKLKYQPMEEKIQSLTKEKAAIEKKLNQNNAKLKEVQKQLADESQMFNAIQNNQASWQNKYSQLEKQFQEFKEQKERELTDIKEQLRDIMFYMDAQQLIAKSVIKEEIKEGTVVVPETPKSNKNRKKK